MSTIDNRKFHNGTKRTSFSVAGCGFMGIYHIGMCICIEEHAKELFTELTSWYGASAGSIVGVGIASGVKAVEGYKFMRIMHDDAHKHKNFGRFAILSPNFDLPGHVRAFLESMLPRNAHRLCRNKVGVSLTVLPSMKNWIVSDFNTRAELIQAVVCSCFLPLPGHIKPPVFRGKMCCDGGLSNNLPYSSDPNIITVSPFSGECDICPNGGTETHFLAYVSGQAMQTSWSNLNRGFDTLLMSNWKQFDDICAQGFRDTYNFLKREGIIPITLAPVVIEASMIDNDTTSGYPRAHLRQSSSVSTCSCLDELLGQLEKKRNSILFVEEPSDDDDDDSGIFLKPAQLQWKLKPKDNGLIVTD